MAIIIIIGIQSNHLHLNDDLHSNVIYSFDTRYTLMQYAIWEYKQRILNFSSTGHDDNVPLTYVSHWYLIAHLYTRVSEHYFDEWTNYQRALLRVGNTRQLGRRIRSFVFNRRALHVKYKHHIIIVVRRYYLLIVILVILLNTSTVRTNTGRAAEI